MPDIEVPCIQCKQNFLFLEKEQEQFYQSNFAQPQRCPKCRSKKNLANQDAAKRFTIACDNCGKPDTVPFQPKIGRSILCKDCFQASKVRRTAS
jgi:CxxC-x17-CxxC domain-containing protein